MGVYKTFRLFENMVLQNYQPEVDLSTPDLTGLYTNVSPSRYQGSKVDLIVQRRPNTKPGSPSAFILSVDQLTNKRTHLSGLFSNPDGSFRFDIGKGSNRVKYRLEHLPTGLKIVKL